MFILIFYNKTQTKKGWSTDVIGKKQNTL